MSTIAQLGLYTPASGAFKVRFDFNDRRSWGTVLQDNLRIESPTLKTSLVENFSVPGGDMATSQFGFRNITVNFYMEAIGGNVDDMLNRWEKLLSALDGGGHLRFRLNGAEPSLWTRYYEYLRAQPIPLVDGREMSLYEVAGRKQVTDISVTLLCQPFAEGETLTL